MKVFSLQRSLLGLLVAAGVFASGRSVAETDGEHRPSLVASDTVPVVLQDVGLDEKLGSQLDVELRSRSEDGAIVRLGDVLGQEKPVLLTLNYYTCETLCSVQLNAVLEGLKELDWVAGEEFIVVTVSIDPAEGSELAAKKRKSYLDSLGKGEVAWRFLTADASTIEALTRSVGYKYRFDPESKQFAHPAVITFLAPGGSVARYLYGVQYPARDIKFALMEAAAGRVGSPVERLVLSCFQYDHTVGKYSPAAFGFMRLGGLFSLAGLGGLGLAMWRRELGARKKGSTK